MTVSGCRLVAGNGLPLESATNFEELSLTDTIRCPDCGRANPATRETCEFCNHPLREGAVAPLSHAAEVSPARPDAAAAPGPFAAPGSMVIPPRRPIRPRRPRSRGDNQVVLQLWLVFGTIAVAAVLWVAVQTNMQRAAQPVEGANDTQRQRAEQIQQALAADSNDVAAHRAYADLLYDTANWPEAIVHYRAAIRRDSSLATAMVDLGVCYFNLSHTEEAEQLFELALQRDPHQPVALFNLGIVYESRQENEKALAFFHRAMQAGPPESMKPVLQQHMEGLMQKLGKSAPPLPGGR